MAPPEDRGAADGVRPEDPADRLSYQPGDQAQCDLWFPPAAVPLGARQSGSPPLLVMVASHSRFITGRMLPVPAYRGPAGRAAGRGAAAAGLRQRGRHRQRRALAEGVAAFTGALPARIVQLRPYDPEYKGIMERANGDLEASFLPAGGRSLPGRRQRAARRLAPAGQRPPGPQPGRPSRRPDRRGPGRDDPRCPRSRRRPGSPRPPGCPGTTTCASWATTTPSTPRSSAA